MVLYGEALPFFLLFLAGKVTLSYTFHTRWYPLHIPTVEKDLYINKSFQVP